MISITHLDTQTSRTRVYRDIENLVLIHLSKSRFVAFYLLVFIDLASYFFLKNFTNNLLTIDPKTYLLPQKGRLLG